MHINGNGYRYHRVLSLVFVLLDSLVILLGVAAAGYFRFRGGSFYERGDQYWILKGMLILLVFQIIFHYFGLHDPRVFREKKRLAILIMESIGVCTIVLSLIYYSIPFFFIGRGILGISLLLIAAVTFVWRFTFAWILKIKSLRERILIIGTGELAKTIRSEILENGRYGFEIVGFIDENREKVGTTV